MNRHRSLKHRQINNRRIVAFRSAKVRAAFAERKATIIYAPILIRHHFPNDMVRQGRDGPGVHAGESAESVRLHSQSRHLVRRIPRIHAELGFRVRPGCRESAVSAKSTIRRKQAPAVLRMLAGVR